MYRALWRHKYFIFALTAVFVVVAAYLTTQQTAKYEATTLVRVQERGPRAGDASAALVASQTLAQTYAKIIGSGALAGEIKTLVTACSGGRRPSTPAAPSRQRGSAATNTRANSCAALGGARNTLVARRTLSEVGLSGSPVQDLDLLEITARGKQPTSAMVVANAAPLALREFVARTGSGSEQIVIAKAATVPSSPVSRHLALNIAIALVLGLIFNGALALLIELFRDRLPDPEELGQALGQPVLATIPTLRLHELTPATAQPERTDSILAIDDALPDDSSSRPTRSRVGPEP